MQVGIEYGLSHVELEIPEARLVGSRRQPPVPGVTDPVSAVREALEHPTGYPALRRAMTPDDHVAVVLDLYLPQVTDLLGALLDHVGEAGLQPEAVTIVLPTQCDAEQKLLADAFPKIRVEVHNPNDRQRMSYLATTKQGRRIYLNRTVVDADQVVVLGRRSFDPLLGYSGAEGALYPVLSDDATHREMTGHLTMAVPDEQPWSIRREAIEVAWLLGAPFFVQLVEGPGDQVASITGGQAEAGQQALDLLNNRWRVVIDEPPETVVAAVSGDPRRHSFGDLGAALACAARVVAPEGRIVLLTEANPQLGPGADVLRHTDGPSEGLKRLRKEVSAEIPAAFEWASAAQKATIYLLSQIPPEVAEELYAIPLDNADQAARILAPTKSCLLLPDAHKSMAVLSNGT